MARAWTMSAAGRAGRSHRPHARRTSSAGTAGRPPRPEPGDSVRPGRLVELRARRLRSAGPAGRPRWRRARRLSSVDGRSTPVARAPTMSAAGPAGLRPRPTPRGCVPPGWLVDPRGPLPQAESRLAAGRTHRPRARRLSPAGPACRALHPGASAFGVRGASSDRPTRPASVGSSGTARCQPPQAFPHHRPGPSFGLSVRHRGRPRVLVDPCRRPYGPCSPAGATSGPEAGHRHAGATGTIPQAPPACWKSSACDVAKSRPSWLPKERTIYKRPPGGARQPSRASAGRSRITGRPGRPAGRP